MDNTADICNHEGDGDGRKDACSSSSSPSTSMAYKLFDRKSSVHQAMGGGKAADVILWKRWRVSSGVIIVATVAWLVFERSELSFLSICSNVILILIVVMFIRANYVAFRDKQLETVPELVLSEEMVISAASSFRVKINYMLLMAHDITLGKDFKLFFKVVIFLWLLSVIGSYFSFFTLAYIGTIVFITVPALYSKFEDHVDKYCGVIHQRFSNQYKIVDESVLSRLPRSLSKDKDT